MQKTDRFQIDEPRVISEVMDGELVLVHFESGCYYSVRGTGADVCQLLTAGGTVGEIVSQLATRHGLATARVESDVRTFIAKLIEEKLLVPVAADRPKRAVNVTAIDYSVPSFEKFDDMADQLLLDPIHEIDQTGWPARRAG